MTESNEPESYLRPVDSPLYVEHGSGRRGIRALRQEDMLAAIALSSEPPSITRLEELTGFSNPTVISVVQALRESSLIESTDIAVYRGYRSGEGRVPHVGYVLTEPTTEAFPAHLEIRIPLLYKAYKTLHQNKQNPNNT